MGSEMCIRDRLVMSAPTFFLFAEPSIDDFGDSKTNFTQGLRATIVDMVGGLLSEGKEVLQGGSAEGSW